MRNLAKAAHSPSSPTADSAFETLLKDIVSGTYAPGVRLPAERDLAQMLGTSRPTLREALRRLSEWGLLEARRGSGIVVRATLDWSFDVLPAYLRYANPRPGMPNAITIASDLLSFRHAMLISIIRLVAHRISDEGIVTGRDLVRQAWEARDDGPRFSVLDLAVIREIASAASFLPAVWMLNQLADVYTDLASSFAGTVRPPDDYLESHERFFDALAERDTDRAVAELSAYLDRHDSRLLAALGVVSGDSAR